MARKQVKLFNYGDESRAKKTLKALREAWPDTIFTLTVRPDWRLYIMAQTQDGERGYVAKAPLASIKAAGYHIY